MLFLEPTVHVRAVSEGGFSDKRFASSTVSTFSAQVDTTKGLLTSVLTGRGLLLWLRTGVMRNVVPQRHPFPLKPAIEATASESEALPRVSLSRTRWVAEHAPGEHLKVPPGFLGVVKNGIGDRPGKAPGPQRLKFFRDMANDWRKARVNVGERGARFWSKSGDATTDRRGSTKAVAHGRHCVRGLGCVTARRAGAPGAEADEATAQ